MGKNLSYELSGRSCYRRWNLLPILAPSSSGILRNDIDPSYADQGHSITSGLSVGDETIRRNFWLVLLESSRVRNPQSTPLRLLAWESRMATKKGWMTYRPHDFK